MNIERIHISILVGLTAISWITFSGLFGTPILSPTIKPFGAVVTFISGILVIFKKWAWTWKIFQGWLVNHPDIRGTWQVKIKSNWIDPETKSQVEPITAYATIKQSLTTLSVKLMTKESKSKLITYSIKQEADSNYCISVMYLNQPNISLQKEKSRIHYGSFKAEIIGKPTHCINGHYWTDRGTTGEIKFTDRKNKIYMESYEEAESAYQDKV